MPTPTAARQFLPRSSTKRQASGGTPRVRAARTYASGSGFRTPVWCDTNVHGRYRLSWSVSSIIEYQTG